MIRLISGILSLLTRRSRQWQDVRDILKRDRIVLACWKGRWLP